MNPIIGQAIKDRLESIGMSKAELARRLNMSPANVHKIFKRATLDIGLLWRAGHALSYDFISHYQYLTTNAIHGRFQLATAAQDPKIIYPYSLRIKVMQLLEISQRLLADDPAKPISQFVKELDFIQHGLNDIRVRMDSEK